LDVVDSLIVVDSLEGDALSKPAFAIESDVFVNKGAFIRDWDESGSDWAL
jgi:hypothetical protein